ncbi:phosphatase inhibitor-domain-containing protein [Phlyctochytrium arcticum]|nr:phosphatase inhibitor-domain-containing protein [Phlyctochytrium arcticum]
MAQSKELKGQRLSLRFWQISINRTIVKHAIPMSNSAERRPEPAATRLATAPAGIGSQTVTQSVQIPETAPDGTLLLRGGSNVERRVQWDEKVIDNEGLGKKSSKVCCIYRKPHNAEDSDSDSESDSSADPDEPNAYEREPPSVRRNRQKKIDRKHQHEHAEGCTHHAPGGPSHS